MRHRNNHPPRFRDRNQELAKEKVMQNPVEVTVRNRYLYVGAGALKEFGEKDVKLTLMHKVALTRRSVETEIETLDEIQDKNTDKYVLRDEDGNKVPSENGNGFKLDPEKLDEFQKVQKELMNEEIKIVVYPIKSSDLGENGKLKANIAFGLMAIGAYEIVDDDEPKKDKKKKDEEAE